MPLRLEDWGQILLNYYKNNSDSFYVSLDNIIEGAREHDPALVKNLTNSLIEKGSAFTVEEHLSRLFARALGARGRSMDSSDIAKVLRNTWENGPIGSDLCVLALLICACEAHTVGIRQYNYYDRLRAFLGSKDIGYSIESDAKFSTPFFNKNSGLDLMGLVQRVNRTCENNSIPLTLTIGVNNRGGNRYTNALMGLCLINGTLVERFKRIFGQSGFTPIEVPTDEELLVAFRRHHSEIHISDADAEIMLHEQDMLLRAMRKAYDSWDGSTTYITKSSRNKSSITETGTTIESIVLSLVPKIGSKDVEPQAFVYSEAEIESNLRHYTLDNYGVFDTLICNGKSRHSLKNDTINLGALAISSFVSGTTLVLKDDINDCQAKFKLKNFYLFSNCLGIWEESIQPSIGKKYLLLVNKANTSEVLQSLGESAANLYDRITSPIPGFDVLMIESLKALPSGIRRGGKNKPNISIDNFIFGEDSKTLVLNNNRLIVKIDGLINEDSQVRITSADNTKTYSLKLCNGEWTLDFTSIRFDHFDRQRLWNLYIDTQRCLDYEFKFGDFQLPETMRGMSLSIDGEICHENGPCGLELSAEQKRHGNIVDATKLSIQGNLTALPTTSAMPDDLPADILLYALSALCYDFFSLKDIEDAAAIMAPELLENLENTLADWFALGYLNIGNDGSQRKFVANQPTLILLTPDYAPANVEGVRATSVSHFTSMLTGGRDRNLIKRLIEMQTQNPSSFTVGFPEVAKDMPHTIFIHSKDIKVFSEIAKSLKLLFNPRVYAPAMFAGLPSISQYKHEARKRSAAYSGEALTYNIDAIASDLESGVMKSAASYKKYRRNEPGFNIYSVYGRKVGVMVRDDESYHVGKNWGLWIQAAETNQRIAKPNGNELIIPGVTPLPRIYHRALCLITGKLPRFDRATKTNHYHLASNPTATGQYVTGEGIINKLS